MTIRGIDLSVHNAGLTISAAKAAGYKFAILRAGFTGWGAGRSKNKDGAFEEYYAEAKAVGFPIGAYWYSCANSAVSGKAEAEYLYENCLKDKQFEYPIYIDVEETRWQMSDKKGVTDAIIAFCRYLEKKGFFVGIYSSISWFNYQLETERLNGFTKWVAAWRSEKPAFAFNAFDMWQYSDKGFINGRAVDLNYAYRDFPAEIKAAGLNGYARIKGDVDGDGKVTAQDARKALRAAVKAEKLNKAETAAADMDYDGNVTADDAREIMKRAAGQDIFYTVQNGDTLAGIAKKYGTTSAKLKKANGLKDAKISAGQKIKITG